MIMLQQIIVDTDLCLKLGGSEKYRLLELILPLVAEKIYIHTCVYEEILTPHIVHEQIDTLMHAGLITLVDESGLGAAQNTVYQMTYRQLEQVMINPDKPHKNKGEVCSLSYAKAASIPIFATDESKLQPIIDRHLNTGIDDITCLRIKDIVMMIKSGDIDLPRKTAKMLWRISGKSAEVFNTDIWPAP